MAKAKDESTAVNELIQLAATRGPAVHDPADDLFAEPSRTKARPSVDELAPLPRSRAPQSTQEHSIASLPLPSPSSSHAAPLPPPLPHAAPRASSPNLAGTRRPPTSPPPLPAVARTTTSSPAIDAPRAKTPPPLPAAARTTTSSPAIARTTSSPPAVDSPRTSTVPPPVPPTARRTTSGIAIPLPRTRSTSSSPTIPAPGTSAASRHAVITDDEPTELANIPLRPSTLSPEAMLPPDPDPAAVLANVEAALAARTPDADVPADATVPSPSFDLAELAIDIAIESPVSSTAVAEAASRETRPAIDDEPIATRSTRPSLPSVSAVASARSLEIGVPTPSGETRPFDIDPASSLSITNKRPLVDTSSRVLFEDNTDAGSPRLTTWQQVARFAPWMGVMVVLGAFVGGYIAFDGQGGKKRTPAPTMTPPTAASVAAPAPAPDIATPTVPVVAPAPISTPDQAEERMAAAPTTAAPATPARPSTTTRAAFVDVRIDSKPTGATVTLLDRGKSIYLGTTPLRTSVDSSRMYELEFTHSRRRTPQREKLDPRASTHLSITLEKRDSSPAIAKIVAPAPTKAPAKAPAKTTAKAPEAKVATTETKPVEAKAPVAGGEGVLMISSKPPCEIYVDGKATGLTTPQRALSLPAGKHRITLVNQAQNVKKTVSVDINAGASTKVIENLMAE